jgi:hypothetical protein
MRTIAAMMAAASGGIVGLEEFIMGNPWDVPPVPERGDDKPEPIYTAVGHALSTWELVEEELASLFALMVGQARRNPETQAAIRAYGSIVSSKARIDMLNAAAKGFFHGWEKPETMESFANEFTDLMTMIGGWVGRRNDVAHGRVSRRPKRPDFILMPSLYNSKKNSLSGTPSYAYSSNEIIIFRNQFDMCSAIFRDYWYRLLDARYPSLRTQLQQEFRRNSPRTPNPSDPQ